MSPVMVVVDTPLFKETFFSLRGVKNRSHVSGGFEFGGLRIQITTRRLRHIMRFGDVDVVCCVACPISQSKAVFFSVASGLIIMQRTALRIRKW